jgi:hypothetical protein
MKNNSISLVGLFMGASLLLSNPLKAEVYNNTAPNDDDLSNLLSPEERALVEKELDKQPQKESPSKTEKADLGDKSSNPYATLLDDTDVTSDEKTNKDSQDYSPQTPEKQRSSYSSPSNYKRYKTGNRRPGDALKSTPSQRTFGD